MKPRCLIVCVNYDDILAITLPRNIDKFSECCVITSPADIATIDFVAMFPEVRLFVTDAFYRHGAKFNKGLAIEEAFDFFGRHGWMLVLDADIVLPYAVELAGVTAGNIYGANRRMLLDPAAYADTLDWGTLKLEKEHEIAGFFQLFHADDTHLQVRPWYEPTFMHAGGCDAYFQQLWPRHNRIRLPLQVLHIGPRDTNWFGRVSSRTDGATYGHVAESSQMMRKLKVANKWLKHRQAGLRDTDPVEQANARLQIPGYDSKFKWFNSEPKDE